MNLDECLTYFYLICNMLDFHMLFFGLINYFGHFNNLLGKDMFKLLWNYNMQIKTIKAQKYGVA